MMQHCLLLPLVLHSLTLFLDLPSCIAFTSISNTLHHSWLTRQVTIQRSEYWNSALPPSFSSSSAGSRLPLILLSSTSEASDERQPQKYEEVLTLEPEHVDESHAGGNSKYGSDNKRNDSEGYSLPKVVLVAGFESFNRELYSRAASKLNIDLHVFSDSEIRISRTIQQQIEQDKKFPTKRSISSTTIGLNDGGVDSSVNPEFAKAVLTADAFIASLVFDYDDVLTVQKLLAQVDSVTPNQQKNKSQIRFIFESATELMQYNRVGSFSMMPTKITTTSAHSNTDSPVTASSPGPPPAVKAILSKFGTGKEEDKLAAYIKLLKFGPDLLKYIPGERASDLRTWLEVYRYWNQGGSTNVQSMLQRVTIAMDTGKIPSHVSGEVRASEATTTIIQADRDAMLQQPHLKHDQIHSQSGGNLSGKNSSRKTTKESTKQPWATDTKIPELVVTPDIGLIHPLLDRARMDNNKLSSASYDRYFSSSPALYMKWRMSSETQQLADQYMYNLAPHETSPVVAVLLYRKHVVTELPYISDLINMMEHNGIIPVPIFINGVEAHTIVRDLLTSTSETQQVRRGTIVRDSTYQPFNAVNVDAIVNTIGFPLVGGPAGSMESGRNVAISEQLLSSMNVPYIVASPLLLQSIPQWKKSGVLGLQSVVLYSLPELDGAIDTVVLGGLVGDKIALVPERVRKLVHRIQGWVNLRKTPVSERKIAISLYGFPPNVGAVGTAALLDVPSSLNQLLLRLKKEGYNVGDWGSSTNTGITSSGESLVAALGVLCENPVVSAGSDKMADALENKIIRARAGDVTVPSVLALPGGGLGGAKVRAENVSLDQLELMLGSYMMKKVARVWLKKTTSSFSAQPPPGLSRAGECVVAGLELGNVFLFVQPLLGVEGDPMRLLFERDLTPHPQYCATYKFLTNTLGSQAIIHFGMHGTVEWLPGQPLGNDRASWSDELLGPLPNIYIYAANNPSESILAKRRGYGTLVSYNVPPYGRSGLYLELANLKDLIEEYRSNIVIDYDLGQTIFDLAQRSGMLNDVPLLQNKSEIASAIEKDANLSMALVNSDNFSQWIVQLSDYLSVLQDRLFSSGLRVLGSQPTDEELNSYLEAYFGDRLSSDLRQKVLADFRSISNTSPNFVHEFFSFIQNLFGFGSMTSTKSPEEMAIEEASSIAQLLSKSTDEMESVIVGLDGGYIRPKPGGDLLRDGPAVLPTGRNIHALDPYRMPSTGAWVRGQKAAEEIIRQHKLNNKGRFPETVAVTLWGLDAIKTRGESVAIVLALVGAKPVKEGTGRIVRYDLIPLEELGRPRIDVLASLSGIFRDSFANVVDLLDDMFERAARADEPVDMNFIKMHSQQLLDSGVKDRTAARLFSNPPGDYGSMVNEVVGTGDWEESDSLGETWRDRNVFSYGRNEGSFEAAGTARPDVLEKLLATTERVVQEIDSIEYGLTDIQEYYANTGALKKAAENRKEVDPNTGKKRKVAVSVIEAFGGGSNDDGPVPVKDVEEVLRLEYRSKLLNPKWRDAMLRQGSGGAYEISQRMTAMVGWAATTDAIDNFVFDQAAERYALDETVAKQLQRSNPEAFKNVIRRLLEANGRGMWSTNNDTLERLRDLYSEADDVVEAGTSTKRVAVSYSP